MAINSTSNTDPGFYTDLNSLQKIKNQSKTDSPEALRRVAQQFEQMFLKMLMTSMRDANEAFGSDDVFNSSQVRFYQDMMDSQVTLELSQGGSGVGLTDVLVRQLSQQFDIRMDSDKEDQTGDVSESERLLNRAFSVGAMNASSQVLGQIQSKLTDQEPGVTPVDKTVEALAQSVASSDEPAENLPDRFNSPEEFVEALLPLAEKMAGELGVDPKVLVAQAALETGWGKYVIKESDGSSSYNLFNIKAGRSWDGDRAQVSTLEYRDGIAQKERADFRSYGSYQESFRDYVDFLKNSTRYQQALNVADSPLQYLQELQQAGYATDPAYADKINSIFENRILSMAQTATKEG
ncbi:flagellar assembly peptidoglycan hydrolase FlgJ [Neptunomonas phycophila]|uniref:flagellar assembly peptidoglycan hydrolase FlgJ n=1 Tax=Neptunomonas phycophila TaxID=1572645 RepID=UPI003736B3BE